VKQATSSRHHTILNKNIKTTLNIKKTHPRMERLSPLGWPYSIPLFMKVEQNIWKHFGNPHSAKPTVMTYFSKPLSVKIFRISQLTV